MKKVEPAMYERKPVGWADLLDELLTAAQGVFPGPALERLIARMEERA
jgi:hypothetical protein